jgi:hypothetical protein
MATSDPLSVRDHLKEVREKDGEEGEEGKKAMVYKYSSPTHKVATTKGKKNLLPLTLPLF